MVSQVVDFSGGVALSVLRLVCLLICIKNKCTRDGARGNQCQHLLPGERAQGRPSAGSWDVNTCYHSASCFGQCSHPWKLLLRALQTLYLLQRLVPLFAVPLFSPSPPFPAGAEGLTAPSSTCPPPLGLLFAVGVIVTTLTPHLAVGRECTWGHR